MNRSILYGLIVGLFFVGCNNDNTSKSEMQELKEVISDLKREQCKLTLSQGIVLQNNIGIKESKDLKIKCNNIMKYIGKGDMNLGFEEIKKYTWISDEEIDLVREGTEKQLKILSKRYGSFVGYEFIKQKEISSSVRKFTYIAKCKNHPLVWTFIFYKADKKWTLNYFNWHDKLQNL